MLWLFDFSALLLLLDLKHAPVVVFTNVCQSVGVTKHANGNLIIEGCYELMCAADLWQILHGSSLAENGVVSLRFNHHWLRMVLSR